MQRYTAKYKLSHLVVHHLSARHAGRVFALIKSQFYAAVATARLIMLSVAEQSSMTARSRVAVFCVAACSTDRSKRE
jgi:hypothetical protein